MKILKAHLLCVTMAILVQSAVAISQNATQRDLDNPDRNATIFGQPQSGRIIVDDLKKACPHLAATLKSADREQRTLVFTNLDATAFHTYVCTGACDEVQQNNSVVECRKTIGIDGCRMYGAVFRGDVFQFSVDPAGTVLETDCDLKAAR